MRGMKLSWKQFWGLLWTYTQKIPVDQTGKLLGVSRPTIYRWYRLFCKHLPDGEDIRLDENIQIDEAYLGRRDKKAALLAAKQKGTSKVAVPVIQKGSVDKASAVSFLQQFARPGTLVHSDGALIYKGLHRSWPVSHEYDVHRKGEFLTFLLFIINYILFHNL